MKRSLLFLCCLVLARCNGGQGSKDGPPPDTRGVGEGIYFQDGLPGLHDRSSHDGAGLDRAAGEDQRGDRARLDLPPDAPRPDQPQPDSNMACATDWSKWSCVVSGNGCAATCSSYQLTCSKSSFVTICICKHGAGQKSCTVGGTGCSICGAAVSQGCCNKI